MVNKKLVKPLSVKTEGAPETKDKHYKATAQTSFKADLQYLVRKKYFLIKPRVISSTLTYLPCWRVVLSYSVSYFQKNRATEGKIEFIVDPIKGCAANEEGLNLKLVKKAIPQSMRAAEELTKEQAEKKAVVDARWKVLMAKFKRPPELETEHMERFYRPYYQVAFTYGRKVRIQWVAADDFASYFVYN